MGDFFTICLAFSNVNFHGSYKNKVRQHYSLRFISSLYVFSEVRAFKVHKFAVKKWFHKTVKKNSQEGDFMLITLY